MSINRTINKVTSGSEILLDLTNDDVAETNLLEGVLAHNREGEPIRGEVERAADYNALANKPQINEVMLVGNKSGEDLGLLDASLKGVSGGVASLDNNGKVPDAQLTRAVANGLATLDSNGKVPAAQLANPVTSGTEVLEDGVSDLATGTIYLQYEV